MSASAYALQPADDAPFRVLVVEDDPSQVRLLGHVLEAPRYAVHAVFSGAEALVALSASTYDIVLLDQHLPDLPGDDICRHVREVMQDNLLPIIIVTGSSSDSQLERSFAAGATDFVRKPYRANEIIARVNSAATQKRLTDQLDDAEAVLFALARMVEAKDASTGDHCGRLARLAEGFGHFLGLDLEHRLALRRGGVLHDIGKLGIPDRILLKADSLTDDEWAIMRTHTVIGDRLCASLKSFRLTAAIVRSHHERWDGGGYPDQLSGSDIPLLARAFQLCDIFDALTNARAYKPALPVDEALSIMDNERARGWRDPDLTRRFVEMVEHGLGESAAGATSTDLGFDLYRAVLQSGPHLEPRRP